MVIKAWIDDSKRPEKASLARKNRKTPKTATPQKSHMHHKKKVKCRGPVYSVPAFYHAAWGDCPLPHQGNGTITLQPLNIVQICLYFFPVGIVDRDQIVALFAI